MVSPTATEGLPQESSAVGHVRVRVCRAGARPVDLAPGPFFFKIRGTILHRRSGGRVWRSCGTMSHIGQETGGGWVQVPTTHRHAGAQFQQPNHKNSNEPSRNTCHSRCSCIPPPCHFCQPETREGCQQIKKDSVGSGCGCCGSRSTGRH